MARRTSDSADRAWVSDDSPRGERLSLAAAVPAVGTRRRWAPFAELAAHLLDAPSAQVWLRSDEPALGVPGRAAPDLELVSPSADRAVRTVGAGGTAADDDMDASSLLLATRVARDRTVLALEDRDATTPASPRPRGGSSARAWLGVPVTGGNDRLQGVISVHDDRARPWGPDDIAALQRLAAALGAALDDDTVADGSGGVARVLEAIPTAFFQLDGSWRFTYVNAAAETLLGAYREQLLGAVMWEAFPAASGSDFEAHYRRAMGSGQAVRFDAYYPQPLDAWYEVHAWPSPEGLSVYFIDVTTRYRAQQRAERAARHSDLLARVTAALTRTLDAEDAVGRLATLVVPELGDYCLVTLVDGDEHQDWRHRLRDVGCWHADPARREVVSRYADLRMSALSDESFLAQTLDTDRLVLVPQEATEEINRVLTDPEARELCRELAPDALAVVPLPGRDRTVGLLSVFRTAAAGPFDPDDLGTMREIAARAGMALDNARLFAQQRDLAAELQRSLLTPPPQHRLLQFAVRYEAAADVARVGGDWYDVFAHPDGSTVLVVGDVIGHDTAAAAAMGHLRGVLRGVALSSPDGPRHILQGLDQAIATLQLETSATAVVAQLQTPSQEGSAATLRWSNAGHPPPMLIGRDRSVTPLESVEPDLLLGLEPAETRTESQIALEPGSTLLLYTDGLIERRGETLDEGLQRLQRALSDLATADLPFEDLCDQLLGRVLPERPEDDIALVAVRLPATPAG